MCELNKIYCYEAANFLSNFVPEGYIDLIVTSPPYDDMRDYTGYRFNFKEISFQLYRVLKNGGVLVWVVGDQTKNGSETCSSFKQAIFFKEKIGFLLHDTMIFHKTGNNFPSSNRYNQIFEYMFVFSKGKPKTFNPICDVEKKWAGSWGKTSHRQKDGSLKRIEKYNEGFAAYGKSEGEAKYGFRKRDNVWVITTGCNFGQKDKIAYKHPATYPESLAEDHILSWSNVGDTILDPMCGSGTTCKMAYVNGRNYVGIDISEEYCDIARKRIIYPPL